MSRAVPALFRVLPLLLLLPLVGCGDAPGDSTGAGSAVVEGAETPTALLESARTYANAGDFGGMVGLIAPDERPVVSFGMVMMSQMAPMLMEGLSGIGGEEGKQAMQEKLGPFKQAMDDVLEKHGLPDISKSPPPQEAMGDQIAAGAWLAKVAPDLDHRAFVADVFRVLSKLGDSAAKNASENFKTLAGEVEGLEIDGDRAHANVGGKPAAFRKIDGRWYITIIDEIRSGKQPDDGPPADGPPSDGPGK